MAQAPLKGWHVARVKYANTPLALGFKVGETVYVGKEAWDCIVLNETQIRFVTEVQARWALEIGGEVSAEQALGHYRSLQKKILATKDGLLVPYYRPKEVPLPKGFPTHFPANAPRPFIIHMADCSPVVSSGRWEADWSFQIVDGQVQGHIWWQQEWLPRLIAHRNWALIHDTHQHEFHEAPESLTMAILLYEQAHLEQLPGLAVQMGGWAHKLTIEVVDGYSDKNGGEERYDRDDDKEGAAVGMPGEG